MSRFKRFFDGPFSIDGHPYGITSRISLKDLYERSVFFDVSINENYDDSLCEQALLSIDEEIYEIAGLIENCSDPSIEKIKNILMSSKFKIHFVEKEVSANDTEGITGTVMKDGSKYILVIHYYPKLVEFLINGGQLSELAFRIGYAAAHELVHMRQYGVAKMSDEILKKSGTSNISFSKENARKKYFKHTRELMAFAHQISYELSKKYPDKERLLDILRSNPVMLLKYESRVGKNYIDVFGENPKSSPVLRRLLRYIYQYVKNGKLNNFDKLK